MWPTQDERVLLRAAIDGDRVQSWDDLVRFFPSADRIIGEYPRLAPLLWTTLKDADLSLPGAENLKRAHMHTWASNQYRVRRATEITTALAELGIRSLMLKGLALLPRYPSFGARPMADIDILVPEDSYDEAVRVLQSLGWREARDKAESRSEFAHASLFLDEAGNELDLHWRLAPDTIVAPQVQEFWRSSITEDFFSVPAQVPGATYQLFHCMSHGLRWSTYPQTQWVADAAFVMKSARDDLEWSRFTELADLLGRGIVVRQGLRFLAEEMQLDIPLAAMRQPAIVPKFERREAWFLSHVGPDSKIGGLPDRWYFYRRISGRLNDAAGLRGFWRYLRWRWAPHGNLMRTTYNKVAERLRNPFSARRSGTSG